MSISRTQGKKLVDAALKVAKSDDVLVSVRGERSGNLRFANGAATTSGDVERIDMTVTAAFGTRVASATGSGADPSTVAQLVAQVEALARFSPPDPERMPTLGVTRTLEVSGHDPTTAKLDAQGRMLKVQELLGSLRNSNQRVFGLLEHSTSSVTLGSKNGLIAHEQWTSVELTCTCRTADDTSSGRGSFTGFRIGDLDAKKVGRMAAETADMGLAPGKLAAGRYRAFLDAQAVGDMLSFLIGSMGRREADEGRSAFSKPGGQTKIGDRVGAAGVHLRSNPASVEHPARSFNGEGEAHPVVSWIRDGVLENLHTTRYWASKNNLKSLPSPSSLHLDGEGRSLIDLLRTTGKGVFISRLWYNRMVEPKTILITGLTRDGTFLVEDGTIVRAVNNFRYNDSPLSLLGRIIASGEPRRVESRGMVLVVPPLVVEDFNLASVSDAV